MNIDITILAADPDTGSEQCDECGVKWYIQDSRETGGRPAMLGLIEGQYSVTCGCYAYGSPLQTSPIDPTIKITLS